MDNERLLVYLDTLLFETNEDLLALEEAALSDHIPIIRRDMQYFLRWLLAGHKPRRILEIGTAVGFSALFMAAHSDALIDTIEVYEPRIACAKNNFYKYDKEKRITLYEGDAAVILPELVPGYDLVFMDAAKGQYPAFYGQAKRLLFEGGVLVVDNVLREGDILESRFMIERRNRTIHKRMRAFLKELTADEDFTADILPIGDGVAVAVKKQVPKLKRLQSVESVPESVFWNNGNE